MVAKQGSDILTEFAPSGPALDQTRCHKREFSEGGRVEYSRHPTTPPPHENSRLWPRMWYSLHPGAPHLPPSLPPPPPRPPAPPPGGDRRGGRGVAAAGRGPAAEPPAPDPPLCRGHDDRRRSSLFVCRSSWRAALPETLIVARFLWERKEVVVGCVRGGAAPGGPFADTRTPLFGKSRSRSEGGGAQRLGLTRPREARTWT